MAQTLPRPTQTARPLAQLDPTRIGAETGTIAINAVLLLLLLAPVAPRIVEHVAPDVPEIVIVERLRPRPVTPPAPQPVEIRRADPVPAPRTEPQRLSLPEAPAVDVVDALPGDTLVDAPAIAPVGVGDGGPSLMPTADIGASLQTLAAPPPPYPRDALRDRLEGTVVLDVHVDAEGRPVDVDIVTSSGHRTLDRAAQRQVLQKWRFRPALRDGRAVPALGRVPVAFVLGA